MSLLQSLAARVLSSTCYWMQMSLCHKNWRLSRCPLPPPQDICSDPQDLGTPSGSGVRPWCPGRSSKDRPSTLASRRDRSKCGNTRKDRGFQRWVQRKTWGPAVEEQAANYLWLEIVSTLLPGLQRTFCPCDGYLSLSITSSLTGANYLKTPNKILGSRKNVLLLCPFPWHLPRAAPRPPCSPPLSQSHKSWQL